MLGVKTYDDTFISASRTRIDEAAKATSTDPAYYNNLVLMLDYLFVHRLRTVEGKDGNPMNEVRVLADSITAHDSVVFVEKAIKLNPDKTVLGHKPGDKIALTKDDFVKLAGAYFEAIKGKFGA